MTDGDFLTVDQAANYVGVSAQTLRRWDAAGKLPAVRRPGSSYRFYRRADLEPFRLEFLRAQAEPLPAAQLFKTAPAAIEGNDLLREPQKRAHEAVRKHFQRKREPVLLVLPVGCGKTGVMATLPFGVSDGRVLIIAPNTTIRDGVADQLDVSSPECFLRKARVLMRFENGPFRAVLDGTDANVHDCVESHFVVANIQQLASSADRWLPQFPRNFFDMILVDEAHHNVADSWRKVFERFPDAKVVSLTATPFRSDGQPLRGNVIYRYSYTNAMMSGYIKQIHSVNAAPSELYFTYRDDQRRHTLDEVMELREEAWFRHGVALSPECNRHIVEASIRRCLELRDAGSVKHQIIAVACTVDHARQVRALYEELGIKAREIYGDMRDAEKAKVLEQLRSGQLDCIVQVAMLGEGFDHPPLSVAAIFRPFRSLSAYIQFVGRIMRVNVQNEARHPDNQGWIISHVGLRQDAHWTDFRSFDLEDQQAFANWLAGREEPTEGDGTGESRSRRFDGGMLVDSEIIGSFIQGSFLDPDDDRVIDMLVKQTVPGTPLTIGQLLSPDPVEARAKLRRMLKEQQAAMQREPEELVAQPQARRKAARKRLAEREGSVVARVLQDLSLSRSGREVARAFGGREANYQRLKRLLSEAVNARLGIKSKERGTLPSARCVDALEFLDEVGDDVRERIREKIAKR